MPARTPENVSLTGEASLQRSPRIITKCRNLARISRICLECAAIFRHLPLTIRCRLGDYTRAMMITRIQTISAAVLAAFAAGRATPSLVSAQSYPPPGALYSPYPPGGYPADYRRGPRPQDFDALEDDQAPDA